MGHIDATAHAPAACPLWLGDGGSLEMVERRYDIITMDCIKNRTPRASATGLTRGSFQYTALHFRHYRLLTHQARGVFLPWDVPQGRAGFPACSLPIQGGPFQGRWLCILCRGSRQPYNDWVLTLARPALWDLGAALSAKELNARAFLPAPRLLLHGWVGWGRRGVDEECQAWRRTGCMDAAHSLHNLEAG